MQKLTMYLQMKYNIENYEGFTVVPSDIFCAFLSILMFLLSTWLIPSILSPFLVYNYKKIFWTKKVR